MKKHLLFLLALTLFISLMLIIGDRYIPNELKMTIGFLGGLFISNRIHDHTRKIADIRFTAEMDKHFKEIEDFMEQQRIHMSHVGEQHEEEQLH